MEIQFIRVQNQMDTNDLFNQLCDKLSKSRNWTSDYRLIKDFDSTTEKPYWESYSYPSSETMIIKACFESIKLDVKKFCQEHSISTNNFKIEIITSNTEK